MDNKGMFSQVAFDSDSGLDQEIILRGESHCGQVIREAEVLGALSTEKTTPNVAQLAPSESVQPSPFNIAQMIEDELNKMLKIDSEVGFIDLNDTTAVKIGVVVDISLARQEDTGLGESAIFYLVRTKGMLHVVTAKTLVLGDSDKLGILKDFPNMDRSALQLINNMLQQHNVSYIALARAPFGKVGGPMDLARKRIWSHFDKLKKYHKLQAKQIAARR